MLTNRDVKFYVSSYIHFNIFNSKITQHHIIYVLNIEKYIFWYVFCENVNYSEIVKHLYKSLTDSH